MSDPQEAGDVLDGAVRYATSWKAEGGEFFGPRLMLDTISLARDAIATRDWLQARLNALEGTAVDHDSLDPSLSFAATYRVCPHCGAPNTGYDDYRRHWREVHGVDR